MRLILETWRYFSLALSHWCIHPFPWALDSVGAVTPDCLPEVTCLQTTNRQSFKSTKWISLQRYCGGLLNTFLIAHPPGYSSRKQSSWGQHGAHLVPVGPRWAPWTLLSGVIVPAISTRVTRPIITKRSQQKLYKSDSGCPGVVWAMLVAIAGSWFNIKVDVFPVQEISLWV